VKFGGGAAQHHNLSMLEHCFSIRITSCLIRGAHLPILDLKHDPPLYTVAYAIGYFVLWPWKQKTSFY
jgi:hypothetical protein